LNALLLTALLALLPLGAGCGYVALLVGGAVASEQSGSGATVVRVNADTTGAIVSVPRADGDVQRVVIRITDPDSDRVALTLSYRVGPDTAPFQTAHLVAVRLEDGTEIRAGSLDDTGLLDTSPEGTVYLLEWNWKLDLGADPRADITLRLAVVGEGGVQGAGLASTAGGQKVGNGRPELSKLAVSGRGGPLLIEYALRDSTEDLCRIDAYFLLEGGARQTMTAVPLAALTGRESTKAPAEPREHKLTWDTLAEPAIGARIANVVVELVPIEAETGLAGTAMQSAVVTVRNNEPPLARDVSVPARAADAASVATSFTLADPEGEAATVAVRWAFVSGPAPTGGVVSGTATPAAADPLTGLAAPSGGATHAFRWNAAADLGDGRARAVRVEVTPAGGEAAPSGVFVVGNEAPVVTIGEPFPGLVAGDVLVTCTIADSTQDAAFLELLFEADGVPARPASISGTAVALPTGPPGAPLLGVLVWRSGVDLPTANATPVTLRLRASDGLAGGLGAADTVATTVTNSDGSGGGIEPLTVASITPAVGQVIGNTSFTIAGTGFVGVTSVEIGLASVTGLTFTGTGALSGTVTANGLFGGFHDVVVRRGATSATLVNGFRFGGGPAITSITPAEGPVAGGTLVSIAGGGFSSFGGPEIDVRVGGLPLVEASVSPNLITGRTPTGTAGQATVRVATPLGATSGSFRYVPAPAVTALTPGAGPAAGGTALSITGSGFTGGSLTVTLGGAALSDRAVVSDTLIVGNAPPGAAGTAKSLVVSSAGGTATLAAAFRHLGAPTVAAMSPARGLTTGGIAVTVTGTNLEPEGLLVRVGGQPLVALSRISATEVRGTLPAGVSGAADVRVTTDGGDATLAGGFTYVAPLAVHAVAPDRGPAAGGLPLTILGAGFLAGETTVRFGAAAAASVTVRGPGALEAVTPALPLGTYALEVTTPLGAVTLPGAFTITDAPILTSIEPAEGPLTGAAVTVRGVGLGAGIAVSVGGAPLQGLTVVSATEITGTVAATGTAGQVDVEASAPTGQSTLARGFRYLGAPSIASVSPAVGPAAGGTLVLLGGAGFQAQAVTVTVGGAPVFDRTVLGDALLSVRVPPGGASGNAAEIVVTTRGGSASLVAGYLYLDPPTIAGITPASGLSTGGAAVTVTGTRFHASGLDVRVGGAPLGSVALVSPTEVRGTLPPGVAGPADVRVATAGGIATSAGAFTYVVPLAASSVTPAQAPTSGGLRVTIQGTAFVAGATTVRFGGVLATGVVVASSTVLTAVTPALPAGPASIEVSTALGTATLGGAFSVTEAPAVATIEPDEGPLGARAVTVRGAGFGAGTTVLVGGAPLAGLTVVSPTEITGSVPAVASARAADVVVRGASGESALTGGYRYLAAPRVGTVTPGIGPEAVATPIVVTGTGFLARSVTVTLGGLSLGNLFVASDTLLSGTAPALTGGVSVDLVVTTPGGSDGRAGAFLPLDPPTITGIAPSRGPTTGAVAVTITGTRLHAQGFVARVGGAPLTSVSFVSSTEVRGTLPAGVSGPADIEVTTDAGVARFVGGFDYVAPLTVRTVAPDRAPRAGGLPVTILGAGFLSGETSVSFGGVAAASVSVAAPGALTAVLPPLPLGTLGVRVTTPFGDVTAAGALTTTDPPSIASITPAEGPLGGALVTVSGAGFSVGTEITVGGAPLLNPVFSPTSITGTVVPTSTARGVDVVASTPDGTSTLVRGFHYVLPPTIDSITPSVGRPSGFGIPVEIRGSGFATSGGAPQVVFDPHDGFSGARTKIKFGGDFMFSPVIVNDGLIRGGAPNRSSGEVVDITVTTPGGGATLTAAFLYLNPPEIGAIEPTYALATEPVAMTITGTDFHPQGLVVEVGGVTLTGVVVEGATRLRGILPPRVAGTGLVRLRTAGGDAPQVPMFESIGPLTISSITPSVGPPSIASVTILGTGFVDGETTVHFGGIEVLGVGVLPGGQLQVAAPAPPLVGGQPVLGAVDVTISTPFATVTRTAGYSYAPAPTLDGAFALDPPEGPLAGSLVVVRGTGFTPQAIVTLGGATLTGVQLVSSFELRGVTPPTSTAGPVDVVLRTAGGEASQAQGFRYLAAPVIASVTPPEGPASGLTDVEIRGAGFLARNVTVTVGDIPLALVTVVSDGLITGRTQGVDVGESGPKVLRVETLAGAATAGYAYHEPPTVLLIEPSVGTALGGTPVTITGLLFTPGARATIGGLDLVGVVVESATRLRGFTPPGPVGQTTVNVSTVGGAPFPSVVFTYTDPGGGGGSGGLEILAVSPSEGSVRGGEFVAIIGSGFIDGLTEVTFAGAPLGDLDVLSENVVVGRTAAHAMGPVGVTVTVGGVPAILDDAYTYLPAVGFTTLASPATSEGGPGVFAELVLFTGGPTLTANVTVDIVSATAGTATFPTDVAFATDDHTVTFPAGAADGSTRHMELTPGQDRTPEPNETIAVRIGSISPGAVIDVISTHRVVLLDDDLRVTTFGPASGVFDALLEEEVALSWTVDAPPGVAARLRAGPATLADQSSPPLVASVGTAAITPFGSAPDRAFPRRTYRLALGAQGLGVAHVPEKLGADVIQGYGGGDAFDPVGIVPSVGGGAWIVGTLTGVNGLGDLTLGGLPTPDPGEGTMDLFFLEVGADGAPLALLRSEAAVASLAPQSNQGIRVLSVAALPDGGFVVGGRYLSSLTLTARPSEPGAITLPVNDTAAGDALLLRFDPSGALMSSSRVGSNPAVGGLSAFDAIAVARDGAVIAVGSVSGQALFGPGEAFETLVDTQGIGVAFMARYDRTGRLDWVETEPGGMEWTLASAVTTFDDGSFAVVGAFSQGISIGGPRGRGRLVTFDSGGDPDLYLAKYDAGGGLIFASHIVGDFGSVTRLAALADGGTVVALGSSTSMEFNANAISTEFVLSGQLVLACYEPGADETAVNPGDGGVVRWVRGSSGADGCEVHAIAVHPDDEIVISGSIGGIINEPVELMVDENGDSTSPSRSLEPQGVPSAFILRLQASGAPISVYRTGGQGAYRYEDAATLEDGSILALGTFSDDAASVEDGDGGGLPLVPQTAPAGESETFFVRYKPLDHALITLAPKGLVRATSAPLPGADGVMSPAAVAVFPDGGSVAVGSYRGVSANFGSSSTYVRFGNILDNADMYVVRYRPDGEVLWSGTAGQFPGNEGDTEAVNVVALPDGSTVVTASFEGTISVRGTGPAGAVVGGLPAQPSPQRTMIARYGPDGAVRWAARVVGSTPSDGQYPGGLAALPDGSVVFAGSYGGAGTLEARGATDTANPAVPALVASRLYAFRYDSAGTPIAALNVTGSSSIESSAVALLPDGRVVIGGYHEGTAFDAPNSLPDVASGGDGSFFVAIAALSPTGGAIERTVGPTSGGLSRIRGVGVLGDGSIVAVGNAAPLDLPDSQSLGNGPFLLRFTEATGIQLAVTDGTGGVTAMTVLPDDTIAVTGRFGDPGAFGGLTGLTTEGGEDAFLARYDGFTGSFLSFESGGSLDDDDGVGVAAHPDGSVLWLGALRGGGTAVLGTQGPTQIAVPFGATTINAQFLAKRYFPR